jgi:uncharacterized protein (TIGR02246 family)
MQDDKEVIRQFTTQWIAAVNTKDIPKLLSMLTEDVVFLPPGFPALRGKRSVEAMYNAFFPQFKSVEQTVVMEEVEVDGDWAFSWGTEKFVLVPERGGPPVEMQSRGLSILRRQPGGSWKFARGLTQPIQPSTQQISV